jgi:hypothetical protein
LGGGGVLFTLKKSLVSVIKGRDNKWTHVIAAYYLSCPPSIGGFLVSMALYVYTRDYT